MPEINLDITARLSPACGGNSEVTSKVEGALLALAEEMIIAKLPHKDLDMGEFDYTSYTNPTIQPLEEEGNQDSVELVASGWGPSIYFLDQKPGAEQDPAGSWAIDEEHSEVLELDGGFQLSHIVVRVSTPELTYLDSIYG